MIRNLLAGISVLALLAGPVLAQSPGTTTRSPGGAANSTTPAAPPKQPAPDPMKQEDVSKINGSAVYGSDGKKLGSVAAVLMKPESKQIDRLVVGEGGVLGIGTHDVALPVDQFSWDADKDGFKLAKTADELKSMPEWKAAGGQTGMSGSSTPPTSPPPSTRSTPPSTSPSTTH